MAISANVMNIETTESGTKVITLSLPDFCHTITAPENYINGLPVIAAQPYGVIMVEDGAADDMPVVCMDNNKEFFSIALSALMAADVHDTISFATEYEWPENIDPSKYLAGLADVEITDPQNGQALIYDSATEKWVNGSAGGGGSAEPEWISIFGDLNEDGAPLDEIEVTAAGSPIELTSYTTKVPLVGQNVKLIIDDTEIDCEVLSAESQIGITNSDNSITIGFNKDGTSGLFAQLEAGVHTVSCFIEKLNPDNILVIGTEEGTGTAQDPDKLYYGDTGEDLNYFDYLAFITQLVPLKIGISMPIRMEVAIVNSWRTLITNQNQYELTMGVGNYYYGLYAGGGQ